MPAKDLVFRFIGVDAGAGREFDRMAGHANSLNGVFKKLTEGAALGAAGVAVASVKMAGDFQQQTNILVTAAGETTKNLEKVRTGILAVARDTGTSWRQLTEGEYQIEKAGIRGADSLKVLRAAAQGAREEGADLSTVTAGMTSVMAGYHLTANKSVQVMNALKTAAGEAKTSFELYVGSLSSVLPVASKSGIALEQVLGALSSMTQTGMSADQASQNLADAIRHLQAPTHMQVAALQQMGLSVTDVQQKLGKRGLTGTLDLFVEAITRHMGKGGLVLQSAFNQSKTAAADANTMITKMPASVAKLAREFQSGGITMKDWRTAIKTLPADQANLATQFAALQNRAAGFSALLKSGGPAAQTFTQALRGMMGDATGMNVALMLTGQSAAGFKSRVTDVGRSLRDTRPDVEGWASTQKLFNVQWDRFKQTAQTAMITLGTKLLPVLTEVGDWATKHVDVIEKVAGALAAIGAVRIGSKALSGLTSLVLHPLGGGKTGGALGTAEGAAGVRVFVTNMPHGGLGGGPGAGGGPVKTAEKDAEKYGPAGLPLLRKIPGVGRLFSGTLGAGLALTGATVTDKLGPATHAVTGGSVRADAPADFKTLLAQVHQITRGNAAATASFKQLGSSIDIKKVRAWVAEWKNAGTGVREVDAVTVAAAHRMVAAHQRAVSDATAQLRKIPGAMKAIAAEAQAAGTNIGAMLDAGLTVGIRQGADHVKIVTKSVVDGVIQTATHEAALGSPSKKTTYIGQMLARGLSVGMLKELSHVTATGKILINKTIDQFNTVRGNAIGMRSGISENLTSGASLSNMPLATLTTPFGNTYTASPTAGGINRFLAGYAARERAFSRNLGLARKHGLSAGEAANIAQMGLDAGGPIAAALAPATRSQIAATDRYESQINATANSIATRAAGDVYGPRLERLLTEIRDELRTAPHKTGSATAKALTAPASARALATSATKAKRAK